MRSLAALALCLGALLLAASVPQLAYSSAGGSGTQQVFLEARLMDNYAQWVAPDQTPSTAITAISGFRNATGGVPVNLVSVVRDVQLPGTVLSNGESEDQFLVQLQKAAGGQLIPEIELDYYLSNYNFSENPGQRNYCNPLNLGDCGPAWFYEASADLLSLSAVREDPHRTLILNSWDTFNRDQPSTVVAQVLQNLTKQGWDRLIVRQTDNTANPIGVYFSCQGLCYGDKVTVVSQASAPYIAPDQLIIGQVPAGEMVLNGFDRQVLTATTALSAFLQLSPDQQAAALTYMASRTQPFVFPLFTYTTPNNAGQKYVWDATLNTQSDGEPFVQLIEGLVETSPATTTSNTSTATTQLPTANQPQDLRLFFGALVVGVIAAGVGLAAIGRKPRGRRT